MSTPNPNVSIHQNHNLVARWLRLDHLYHDIPIEEELLAPRYRIVERQHITLDSWSNQECLDNTSFRKGQLQKIYHEFGLAELAAQSNGFIRRILQFSSGEEFSSS